MTNHLRNDEGTPDLYYQFREPGGEDGNHEYFLEPYQSVWEPMVSDHALMSCQFLVIVI